MLRLCLCGSEWGDGDGMGVGVQDQWLYIQSSTVAHQEHPRVTCSAPIHHVCCDSVSRASTPLTLPWERRGVCRKKGLGTSAGAGLLSGAPGPRLSFSESESGSDSEKWKAGCSHLGPPCEMLEVYAFYELGGSMQV